MIDLSYRDKSLSTQNSDRNSLVINGSDVPEKKKRAKRGGGKRKRLRQSEAKLTTPGFGCPWQAPYDIYYAEYQDDNDETLELHWLRVKRISDTEEKEFLKRILTVIKAPWLKPEHFIATLYLQSSMAKHSGPLFLKGAVWAAIFPAKKLHETSMRHPIAAIDGAWEEPLDMKTLGLVRSTIYVEEIVPGDQVTLDNRRCLPGTEIKGGCISVTE